MKKITKFMVCALVSVFASFGAFAEDFDWSQCWCTYGGGLEEGDVIIDIGTGFNLETLNYLGKTGFWLIPSVEASLEVPVMIWKLPFSFGGELFYDAYGYRGDSTNYYWHSMATGALVKYHVHMPPDNLDLYAGFKLGVGFHISNYENNPVTPYPYHSEMIGATWYFSKAFGLNVELGWPIGLKGSVSFKF